MFYFICLMLWIIFVAGVGSYCLGRYVIVPLLDKGKNRTATTINFAWFILTGSVAYVLCLHALNEYLF